MEFSAYYYKDNNVCIISKKEDHTLDYDKVNNKDNIIINLNDKNAQNIYDFFRNNTIKAVLSDDDHAISIDFSNIISEEFYSDEAFSKLIELLNNLTNEANNTITKCIFESEDENTGEALLSEEKELDSE